MILKKILDPIFPAGKFTFLLALAKPTPQKETKTCIGLFP